MKAIQLYHYRQVFFFILLLSMAALCSHAQTYVNPADNSKHHFVSESNVPGILVKPGVRRIYSLSHGVNFFPAVIIHEGDTSHRYQLEISIVDLTPAPVVKTVVDNNDTRTKYVGAWARETNAVQADKFLNKDYHYSLALNATIELDFTGNKIKWFCEKYSNHGIARIFIDDLAVVNIDMYKNTTVKEPELVFERVLSQGAHKIKVQLIGPSTQAAGSLSIVHDRFEIESTQ